MIHFLIVQLTLVVACIFLFAPGELLVPAHPEQTQPRLRLMVDISHAFIGGGIAAVMNIALFKMISPVPLLDGRALPILAQFVIVLLISDFWIYFSHRAMHAVPLLWRFHRIHHSSVNLDMFAAYRNHPIELVIFNLPIGVLHVIGGFSAEVTAAYATTYAIHSVFFHSNIAVRANTLQKFVNLPNFHHWHHAIDLHDRNFGAQLPLWDRLFKTAHWSDERPSGFGIDDPPKLGLLSHLTAPFRRA